MSSSEPNIDELLNKIKIEISKQIEEGTKLIQSAQQSLKQLQSLSDELKKIAQELSKTPPKTATPSKTTK